MEIALIILVIGIVYYVNSDNFNTEKLSLLFKELDKELSKEFKKRDKRIQELENQIKKLKDKEWNSESKNKPQDCIRRKEEIGIGHSGEAFTKDMCHVDLTFL